MAGISDVVAPELLALTGETVSKVRGWLATNPAFPAAVPSRPAFTEAWRQHAGKPFPEETRRCRLGSRPLYCRLRYRALGLDLIPATGEKDTERFLLLAAYEGCTGLLYYEVFQDLRAEGKSADGKASVGLPVPRFLEFHTTAARWVGLPIERILLTNQFLLNDRDEVLSPQAIPKSLKDNGASPDLIIEVAKQLPANCPATLIPPSVWPYRFLDGLDRFVNAHNKAHAIAGVREGREALQRLAEVPQREDGIVVLRRRTTNEMRLRTDAVAEAVPPGKLILKSKVEELDG
jgi:hypothetical protein